MNADTIIKEMREIGRYHPIRRYLVTVGIRALLNHYNPDDLADVLWVGSDTSQRTRNRLRALIKHVQQGRIVC